MYPESNPNLNPNLDPGRISRRVLLERISGSLLVLSAPAAVFATAAAGPHPGPGDGLPRSAPEDAGVDPQAVLDFLDQAFARDIDLHSVMLYRNGSVIAEGWNWPYASHRPHIMHSLTKSVTACAVGLAIDEGHFSLDDKVVSFFDDELPPQINDHLAALRVVDLLTMRTGHAESVSGSVFRQVKTSWVAEFFKIPIVRPPGNEFLYSSASSFMLSAIVSRTTGQSARDYLEPRLFQPLDIEGLEWGSSPGGISSGGNGLTWKSVDSLKLGILHLNRGTWNGRRVLSPEWVSEATRQHVTDGKYGYGYHWWVNSAAEAYYAEGAFGQFAIVFPEHDAVLSITAGVPLGTALEDLIFQYFPAAFAATGTGPSAELRRNMQQRLRDMRLLPLARSTTSPIIADISGGSYRIEANADNVQSVSLVFAGNSMEFRLSDHRGDHVVKAGISDWLEGTTSITGAKLHHQYESDAMRVVAHAEWFDDATLVLTWQFVETAWVDHVTCRFFENRISITRRTNANYASLFADTLHGVQAES